MMPTDCFMASPAEVVASMCMEGGNVIDIIPAPSNAFVVNGQDGEAVDFTVGFSWADATGMAILSEGKDLESHCVVLSDIATGHGERVEGGCIDGYTSATIVVYMDESFDPEECEACNVDDLEAMGGDYKFCAYRVEIACAPVSVECGDRKSTV